jgi:hypothetical protein
MDVVYQRPGLLSLQEQFDVAVLPKKTAQHHSLLRPQTVQIVPLPCLLLCQRDLRSRNPFPFMSCIGVAR